MTPTTPPPVPGDDKDWTWVLHTPCPECGFVAADVERDRVGELLRANTAEWDEILARPEDLVRARPAPTVWSALEYGAHVRDVHRLYLERLELMLTEDGPHYPNWDQDETAVAERYHDQDPTAVAAELRAAAAALAEELPMISR